MLWLARLDLLATGDGHDHAGESDQQHSDHAGAAKDPHFWLDPMRYADVGDAIAAELGKRDPANAAAYTANAAGLSRPADHARRRVHGPG